MVGYSSRYTNIETYPSFGRLGRQVNKPHKIKMICRSGLRHTYRQTYIHTYIPAEILCFAPLSKPGEGIRSGARGRGEYIYIYVIAAQLCTSADRVPKEGTRGEQRRAERRAE